MPSGSADFVEVLLPRLSFAFAVAGRATTLLSSRLRRVDAAVLLTSMVIDVVIARSTVDGRTRGAWHVLSVLATSAIADDAAAQRAALAPGAADVLIAASRGPVAAARTGTALAGAALLARLIRGQQPRPALAVWYVVFAVPGLLLWWLENTRTHPRLTAERQAATADLAAVRLQVLADLAEPATSAVHLLRDAGFLMAVIDGTEPAAEPAARYQGSLREEARHYAITYLSTALQEWEEHQAADRPLLQTWLRPTCVDTDTAVAQLTRRDVQRLLDWLATLPYRGTQPVHLHRHGDGERSIQIGGHHLRLHAEPVEHWSLDPIEIATAFGALLLTASAARACRRPAWTAPAVWTLLTAALDRDILDGDGPTVAALAAASAVQHACTVERHRPARADVDPDPVLGLAALASLAAVHPTAQPLVHCAALAAQITRRAVAVEHPHRLRQVLLDLVALLPPLAATWALGPRARAHADAFQGDREQWLREQRTTASRDARHELLATIDPTLLSLRARTAAAQHHANPRLIKRLHELLDLADRRRAELAQEGTADG